MRRAPIVISSTAAGLALVLGFHSRGTPRLQTAAGAPATTPPAPASSGQATPTTTAPSDAARSATGSDIRYRYGEIELTVTATGSRITDITVAKEGSTDPRSYFINSQAVPLLQSQAMAAQSTRIDGVSGATYTSVAYAESLQSALDKLHIQ